MHISGWGTRKSKLFRGLSLTPVTYVASLRGWTHKRQCSSVLCTACWMPKDSATSSTTFLEGSFTQVPPIYWIRCLHVRRNTCFLTNLKYLSTVWYVTTLLPGIDTDKFKYPIGSARVTFNNHRSYMKAVSAAFIEIKTPKFTKKVQVSISHFFYQ